MSMKLTPAAAASTTTWPGPGSGSGCSACTQDLGPAGLGDDYRPHDITSFASALLGRLSITRAAGRGRGAMVVTARGMDTGDNTVAERMGGSAGVGGVMG